MLLISDLHLREDSADVVFNDVLPGIAQATYEHQDFDVALLGDIFHIRYRVSVRLLNALRDAFHEWANRRVEKERVVTLIIPGNHDQINVEGRNALETLGSMLRVRVFTEPTWNAYGLWFPYRKPELVHSKLVEMCSQVNQERIVSGQYQNTLFIHHGISGAWMNDGYQGKGGLDPQMVSSFSAVLCGHYHKHQRVNDRITYIGSPYQIDAGESGQEKGYCTWNGQTLTHVPMNWGPRYHRITLQPGEKLDTSNIDARDDVRVDVANTKDAEKVGQMLAELGVAQHTVTPRVETIEARLSPANEGLESYARAYAETIAPEDLDQKKLLDVFGEVTL